MTLMKKSLSVENVRLYKFFQSSLHSDRHEAASNLKRFSRSRILWKVKSGNIATNEVTSPKTLGTRSNSSMGKSAGKWASTRPPLLPIKSYAAVESELMKEIEKLQHGRPCPPSWPFAHRITFPLIDFFFLPLPYLYSFSLRSRFVLSLSDGRNKKRKEKERLVNVCALRRHTAQQFSKCRPSDK